MESLSSEEKFKRRSNHSSSLSLLSLLIFSLLFILYTDVFYKMEKPGWFNDSYSIKYIEKVSIYFKKKFLEFNLNNDMIT